MKDLNEINFKIIGGISTELPQNIATAWAKADTSLTGAHYRPLLYVGEQITKGVNHWFIAEQSLIYSETENHIVKIAVNEFNGKFNVIPHSIEIIF